MEGKKKKHKKKKGNQAKHFDSVSNAEVVMPELDNGAVTEMNDLNEAPSNEVNRFSEVLESDEHARCKNVSTNYGIVEKIIEHLQNEVVSCVQREDDLEERIKKVEKRLSFSLEEVTDLKESRDCLAHENKRLTERVSTLELHIQKLETIASFHDSFEIHGENKLPQQEADVSMAPDILNEDPLEKVSETNAQPPQFSENSDSEAPPNHSSDFLEKIHQPNNADVVSETRQIQLLGLDDSRLSEDVVSVPLDGITEELQPTTMTTEPVPEPEPEPMVPISDAPLIGAPFRLISFFSRYISGADLVDRPRSGRRIT